MSSILKPEGLRGIAMSELSCDLLMQLGRAAAQAIGRMLRRPPVLYLAHDGRRSSDALIAALCAGICTGGGTAHCLGLFPAGAMALLLESGEADGGIALTADDAPYEWNGVRLYTAQGAPMLTEQLEAIEQLLAPASALPAKSHRNCGVIVQDGTAAQRWLQIAAERLGRPEKTRQLRVAVDCANGAASRLAEAFFRSRNVIPLMRCDRPDGLNTNRDCGVRGTDALADFVREQHCDAGFALDGGGSRCIAWDETGELLEGSRLLAVLCQAQLDAEDGGIRLRQNGVAVTNRTNLGFLRYARANQLPLHMTLPAQHSVLDVLRERALALGCDGMGGICFPELPAADGMMTAAKVLQIMQHSGRLLSELAAVMEPVPQISVPVRIPEQWREIWRNDPELFAYITDCEKMLGKEGRLLIREHPREPLLTVTVEGSDFRRINAIAMELAEKLTLCTPAPQP